LTDQLPPFFRPSHLIVLWEFLAGGDPSVERVDCENRPQGPAVKILWPKVSFGLEGVLPTYLLALEVLKVPL